MKIVQRTPVFSLSSSLKQFFYSPSLTRKTFGGKRSKLNSRVVYASVCQCRVTHRIWTNALLTLQPDYSFAPAQLALSITVCLYNVKIKTRQKEHSFKIYKKKTAKEKLFSPTGCFFVLIIRQPNRERKNTTNSDTRAYYYAGKPENNTKP